MTRREQTGAVAPLHEERVRDLHPRVDPSRRVYESHVRKKAVRSRTKQGVRRERATEEIRGGRPHQDGEEARGQSGQLGVVSTLALTNCDTTDCHARLNSPWLDRIGRTTN